MTTSDTKMQPHARVKGDERATLGQRMREAYEQGDSVRSIGERFGRSYGGTHRLLEEAGTTFRGRGGNTRGR